MTDEGKPLVMRRLNGILKVRREWLSRGCGKEKGAEWV
jgi:hypothetical protein